MKASTYFHQWRMMADNKEYRSEDTRTRILEAASSLFSELGYEGTTTRSIAENAGVNEVTIFRHFGSKENLAREIMNQYGGLALAGKLEAVLTGDYHQDLQQIAGILTQVLNERNDAVRMAICEAGRFPEFQEIVAENPRQLRLMLSRYFQNLMDQGLIRPGHPQVLAQAFLGLFFSYTVLKGFLNDTLDPEITEEEIKKGFVELFIHGTQLDEE